MYFKNILPSIDLLITSDENYRAALAACFLKGFEKQFIFFDFFEKDAKFLMNASLYLLSIDSHVDRLKKYLSKKRNDDECNA